MSDANDRLRKARIAAGFRSAHAAAKHFRWTISTYASHENGQTPNIPRGAAQRYAKAFKCSWEWIMTGVGTMRPSTRARFLELFESLPEDRQTVAIEFLEFEKRRQ